MKSPMFDIIKGDNKKIKVLIVDDKTDNIEIAASVLAQDNFTLLFAQSGIECLEIAENEQPDIILLDIMMPIMDGLETCKKLKENVVTAHIAVIFLTAKTDDETLSSSFAAGGYDYIPKPFSSAILLSRVYNQLRIIYKQKALSMAQERLAKAEKTQLLGLLAGGIAHDFNNQLNGIMGFSDLIKDRTADEKINRLADLITECGERCAVLTNNLLAFAGKGKYQIININLVGLIKAAEKEVLSKHPHIQVVLNSSVDDPIVVGDYNQIDSVIHAIVVNAVEAMSKLQNGLITFEITEWDGVEPIVNHKLKNLDKQKYIQLKVTDNGVGIDEEDLSMVFEPFFTTKDLSIGGGMSLAAAYGIIENHGGEISITSSQGKGTEVTILLPRELEKEGADSDENPVVAEDSFRNNCVLVVDDNKMSRILLEDIISAQSYSVLTAKNGKEGVELFRKYGKQISITFLDYVMPQMSGEEVLEKILEIDKNAVVYMISGYKCEQSVKDLLEQGAKGFIKKPFKCKEILNIL